MADLVMDFWDELARTAERMGVEPSKLDGLWRVKFGKWEVFTNASKVDREGIPRFHAMIEYNGGPMGMLNPAGGTIVGESTDVLKALLVSMRAEVGHG